MNEQLPTKDDQLFLECEDWWNNACLNFSHDGLYLYAYGFKEAADILAKNVIESGQRNDVLVNPIVFCYRQYFELSFKLIHLRCLKLLGKDQRQLVGHSVDRIWEKCMPLVEGVFPGQCSSELVEISRLMRELCEADPFATAFRYPTDREGNRSLDCLRIINIRNLAEVIGKMDIIIHGIVDKVYEYQSCKDEIERSG